MVAYKALPKKDVRRFQWVGLVLMAMSAVFLLAVPIFVPIPVVSYVVAVILFLVGVCFLWPPLGIWAASAIPNGVAKVIPGIGGLVKKGLLDQIPDRRDEDDA